MNRPRASRDPHTAPATGGLTFAPARPLVGVPRRGALAPTMHEQAILRRAARLGNFIMVTLRAGSPPRYSCADGEIVRDYNGSPLTERQFQRLAKWLVPA